MDLTEWKTLPYDELRTLFKDHLQKGNIAKTTIDTAYSDAFYLWRNGSKELFWSVVTSPHFEDEAKKSLIEVLSENSTGDAHNLVNTYLLSLRRFRTFLSSFEASEVSETTDSKATDTKDDPVPTPSVEQVEHYLEKWETLENYRLQEKALNKLFFELCPNNTDISDVLLKVSTLNDFYSTNIFSVYPVAKHICSLNIDERLKAGDASLVKEIQQVAIGGVEKNFYSFATKYCSHHNPLAYPIYDSYVDEVLRYFRKLDRFADFQNNDLKDFETFKAILIQFRNFYRLDSFNLKQIDQYIWQLGKEYFPKKY